MKWCPDCAQSVPDPALTCPHCGRKMYGFTPQEALRALQLDPAVQMIRVMVNHDACSACKALEGTYMPSDVPLLPVEECSHPQGCRCYYEPLLSDVR